MQKVFNDCVTWFHWKSAALVGVIILGVVWFAEGASWRLWLGASPLLALVLCALPCLIPLVWLWRKGSADSSKQRTPGFVERKD